MHSSWQAFLQQAGANVALGRVEDFGDPAAERAAALDADIIVDLSHYGLIKAEGPDSATFLQGQLTNDVRRVNDEHSQYSSHLSAKGRMQNLFRLFQRNGAYYLRMPHELVEPSLLRMRKYVLMSKVTLSDASDELLRIGVSGAHAFAALARDLDRMPQHTDDVSHGNGYTVIRVAGPHPRVEVYGSAEDMQPLWQKLTPSARPAGASAWALLDIRAGLPEIEPANIEAFVPQMVNLQLIDGVSFRKGCYTGQEIVARMQYLGKLKRRMYLAHVDAAAAPAVGAELYCTSSESGQGAGKVVAAQPTPAGGFDLLVVVQQSLVDAAEDIRIGDAAGPRLTFGNLPYPFPPEEAENAG